MESFFSSHEPMKTLKAVMSRLRTTIPAAVKYEMQFPGNGTESLNHSNYDDYMTKLS